MLLNLRDPCLDLIFVGVKSLQLLELVVELSFECFAMLIFDPKLHTNVLPQLLMHHQLLFQTLELHILQLKLVPYFQQLSYAPF